MMFKSNLIWVLQNVTWLQLFFWGEIMQGLNPYSTAKKASMATKKAKKAAKEARTAGIQPQEDAPSLKSNGHQPTIAQMEKIPPPQPSKGTTNRPEIKVDSLSTDQINNLEKLAKKNARINRKP